MKKGITRREREVTDINEIVGILDRAKVAHVGMVDDGKPYVVPMNYGYTLIDGKLTLYFHGATVGRKLDILRKNPDVFVEIDTDIVPFEGESACQHGVCYSSVMCEGKGNVLEDVENKIDALKKLMLTHFSARYSEVDDLVLEAQTIFPNTIAAYDGVRYEV